MAVAGTCGGPGFGNDAVGLANGSQPLPGPWLPDETETGEANEPGEPRDEYAGTRGLPSRGGKTGGNPGPALVLRLFLLPARLVLHPAPTARRNGRGSRPGFPAMAVHGDVLRHAGGRADLCRGRRPRAAGALHSAGLSLLHLQSGDLLAAAAERRLARRDGARLLRLGERLQPLRRVGVLVVHGRSLPHGAEQAAVRLHRRRRHGRHAAGLGRHGRARGRPRSGEPAARGGRAARTRGLLRRPPGAGRARAPRR